MIKKRIKFIAFVTLGLIIFSVLLFSKFRGQKDIAQISSSSSNIQSQRQVEDNISSQPSNPLPGITINTSPKVDMYDHEFLTGDIVDSADWELLQSRLRDPKQVVKVRAHGDMGHNKLAKAFDQNDLPAFYEVLNDDKSTGYERENAIIFIGQISDRGNIEAAKVLMDYVQKQENWDKTWHDANNIAFSKWHALDWLGYVGGNDKDVEEFLKKAITQEGIEELTKQWYENLPKMSLTQKSVMENLRGFAIRGLAFSDNLEVHELIRSEYEREKQALIAAGKQYGGYYFNQVVEAMTRMDIIKDIGLDAHKALYDGEGSYSYTYRTYIRKYLLFETIEPVIK